MGFGADVVPPEIQALLDFEAGWNEKMGGAATQDLRWMIGVAMARLTTIHGVHPRALADYVRESLRVMDPEQFDAP